MDRGGGSGRGGPSRQGSSLPRTLHGSLLHTDPEDEAKAFTEEPQPLEALESGQEEHSPYTVYATSSARSASDPYSSAAVAGPSSFSTFEQGSSRGSGEPSRAYILSTETQAEHQQPPRTRQERSLALPSFHTQTVSDTNPRRYASSGLHFRYESSAPPPPGRPSLPPVSSLDNALGTSPYAAPSSQFYSPPRGNTWDTAPHPYVTDRPLARPSWQYAALPEQSSPGRAYSASQELPGYSEAARWGQYNRAENFAQEESRSTAAHLSAARSTILESHQLSDSGRAARLYQPQPQVAIQPSQIPVPSVELAQPFYDIGEPQEPYPEPYSQTAAEISPSYTARTRGTSPTSTSAGESSPLAQRGRTTSTAAPIGWQESRRTETAERPTASTSTAQRSSSTRLGKRKASEVERDDDSDDNSPVRKVPKKTPIACNFCRGRKLKCDGRIPTCSHCDKRRQPCIYVNTVKRRGPGRAPKGHRKTQQEQKADRTQSAVQGPSEPGPSSSAANPPLPPSVSPENPYTRYQGMYLTTPPLLAQAAPGPPTAQAPPTMGDLPSRIPVQPPYPTTQFEFTYPPPRQASSGSRAGYERTTFSDDFGLPPPQLPYPAQVHAQAFEPPRVPSALRLPEPWPALPGPGSERPATASAAARHDSDEDRGAQARGLHEAEYPYDPPAGPPRAPGPGRER